MHETAIDGLLVVPRRRIPDERGTVKHMLREDDPWFQRFGEIYFSTIYRGAIKGWHRHERMGLNYACVHGRIKHVVFDDRPSSPTRGALVETFLGPDHYALVVVPPGVWNGFLGMADESIVANCATLAHGASASERLDPHDPSIPYDWARVDR